MTNDYFDIKKNLLEIAVVRTQERITMVESAMESARDSSNDDTKSSAGDKYETSREMIQQDINRYQKQLLEAYKDLQQLANITQINEDVSGFCTLGSLVNTNKGLYFIAISIGAITYEDRTVFVISPASPIGQLLLGKTVGDRFRFNKIDQEIVAIY